MPRAWAANWLPEAPEHPSADLHRVPHTEILTSRHWSLLLLQLGLLHLCPGHAKESQEHGQVAPQSRGGLQPQHRPAGKSGSGLVQSFSSFPRLDGAIHNLEESGWAGRQKGEAGE